MKKRLFTVLLILSLVLVSVGVYASDDTVRTNPKRDLWIPCNECGVSTHFILVEERQYEQTSSQHRVYDYYEGTCSACGAGMYTYFRGNWESHDLEHIYKLINGSYVDLDKCTVCGYEVYNND